MESNERYQGVVQTYDIFDGAGTILMSDGREVQVRYSSIRGEGVRRLHAGTSVSFMLQETRRGLYAVCVQQE
jgi:cold shock CspA family protein